MSVRETVQVTAVAAVLLVSNAASAAPPLDTVEAASDPAVSDPDVRLQSSDLVHPTVLDGLLLPPPASTSVPMLAPVPETLDVAGIPGRAVAAYQAAANRLATQQPSCRLPWQLIAAIGYVESGHGSIRGAAIGPDGVVVPHVLGPRLDGTGAFALIRDSDGGRLDGDPELDRAVGPMQFIPSSWVRHGADGDGDNRRNPHDLDDAALATAGYLCTAAKRLDRPAPAITAVFSYNHSYDYVRVVLTVAARYAGESPEQWGVGLLPAPVLSPSPSPSSSPPPTTETAAPAAPTSTRTATTLSPDGAPQAPSPQPSPSPAPATQSDPPSPSPDPVPDPSLSPAEPEPSSTPSEGPGS